MCNVIWPVSTLRMLMVAVWPQEGRHGRHGAKLCDTHPWLILYTTFPRCLVTSPAACSRLVKVGKMFPLSTLLCLFLVLPPTTLTTQINIGVRV